MIWFVERKQMLWEKTAGEVGLINAVRREKVCNLMCVVKSSAKGKDDTSVKA